MAVAAAGDVRLFASDVKLLEPGEWLNDNLIAFFFERLAAPYPGVLLLEPSLCHAAAMLQSAEVLREMVSVSPKAGGVPLVDQLARAKLVLAPINDKDSPESHDGGSHWSLLMYERRTGEFVHYDSCGRRNARYAQLVASCLGPLLSSEHRAAVREAATPQQANAYDCGVYVIAMAQAICAIDAAQAGGAPEAKAAALSAALGALTPDVVARRREQLIAQLSQ